MTQLQQRQQLERDSSSPVQVATCLECGKPCLWTERLCFGCLLERSERAGETGNTAWLEFT